MLHRHRAWPNSRENRITRAIEIERLNFLDLPSVTLVIYVSYGKGVMKEVCISPITTYRQHRRGQDDLQFTPNAEAGKEKKN